MSLGVNKITNNSFTFNSKAAPADKNSIPPANNPITKRGEKMKLITATFIAGLGLGAKLFFEFFDGDCIFEIFGKKGTKIVEKSHRNAPANKKILLSIVATLGLMGIAAGAFAMIYTLFKAPKINYEGNVNAFKKGKDMDVYIKGNSIERELYSQMNEQAKNSGTEEKADLKKQFMQMNLARTKVPDFVK